MSKVVLTVFGLILGASCNEKKTPITIVDIGHLDRIDIAKELQIINKYSPKVIALDFMLTTDSLEKDELLKKELSRVTNLVQSTILHKYDESRNRWDSLETFHPKFGKSKAGFSNITTTDDSVFVPQLPMRQFFMDKPVTSLRFAIADNSFGVKPEYRDDKGKHFYFKVNSSFKIISVKDLLGEKFDKKDLDNKIVILGHAGLGENNFYINRQRTKKISGVEIQASIVNEIISVD